MKQAAAVILWVSLLTSPAFAADRHELKEYQIVWCAREQGTPDHVLDDSTKVDCLTREHVVAFAFGPQWAESVGRAISASVKTGKKPGVVLVLEEEGGKILERLNAAADTYHLKVWTMGPEDLHRAETVLQAAPLTPEQPAGYEIYAGLFGGDAKFADATITVTSESNPLLCAPVAPFCPPPVTVSKKITHGKGFAAGLRVGIWGRNEYQNLGFALELSGAKAPAMNNFEEADYSSFVLLPMLRIPLFKTESMPGGRFDLYGGLGFSRDKGRISLYDPALPHAVSGDGEGQGNVALVGASLKFSQLSLFIEHRTTRARLSFSSSSSGEWIDSGEVAYDTEQTIFGLAYRFGP